MSASTAIGMVSESLRTLLVGKMTLSPPVDVTILAPDETGGDRRVNLFLYRVQENAMLKNMDWQVKPGQPQQLTPPPLSLNLFYLLTSYAPNDALTGNAAAHEILGEAMRVFHEHSIVPQNHLVTGLQDAREQIKIMLNPLDPEELGERSIAKRVQQVGVPDIRAPFHPPVVDQLTPLNGPVGTTISLHGQHLTGWRASVTIMGKPMVVGEELTENTLTATIPGDLPPGFHEVRVDIAHLYRRVFFFEVTT
jgi:hypothetical protein